MKILLIVFFSLLLVSVNDKYNTEAATSLLPNTNYPIKALIIDGQNNHKWEETTPVLKKILEGTGLFTVDVFTSPNENESMDNFKLDFEEYDVIIMNYNGADWPLDTQKSMELYMENGRGMVIFHAASASFPNWKAYNDMTGVVGWNNRSHETGYMLRWHNGKMIIDTTTEGKAGHPKKQDFPITIRNNSHPITKGLPEDWMHYQDELYSQLTGPVKNVTLLATGFITKEKDSKSTGEDEPVLLTIEYGKGRIFHTTLGHAPESMQSVGFIITFQRGAEWAATGQVTQTGVPEDFPTADKVSVRKE